MSLSVFQLKVEVLEKQYRPFSQEYLPCKPQALYIFLFTTCFPYFFTAILFFFIFFIVFDPVWLWCSESGAYAARFRCMRFDSRYREPWGNSLLSYSNGITKSFF
jgi:hypothetical protein